MPDRVSDFGDGAIDIPEAMWRQLPSAIRDAILIYNSNADAFNRTPHHFTMAAYRVCEIEERINALCSPNTPAAANEVSTVDVPRSSRHPNEPTVRSLTAIAAILTAANIPNVSVEQTGGGVATLYGGAIAKDNAGDDRYAFVYGPGWFEPHWSAPNASAFTYVGDSFLSADDDGAGPSEVITDGDETAIAQRILAFLDGSRPLRDDFQRP